MGKKVTQLDWQAIRTVKVIHEYLGRGNAGQAAEWQNEVSFLSQVSAARIDRLEYFGWVERRRGNGSGSQIRIVR